MNSYNLKCSLTLFHGCQQFPNTQTIKYISNLNLFFHESHWQIAFTPPLSPPLLYSSENYLNGHMKAPPLPTPSLQSHGPSLSLNFSWPHSGLRAASLPRSYIIPMVCYKVIWLAIRGDGHGWPGGQECTRHANDIRRAFIHPAMEWKVSSPLTWEQ